MPTNQYSNQSTQKLHSNYTSRGGGEATFAQAPLRSRRYRPGHFDRLCDERGIEYLNMLTDRTLQKSKLRRHNEGDLSRASVKTQSDTLWSSCASWGQSTQ